MSYLSDISFVMDRKTFDKFDELKKENKFSYRYDHVEDFESNGVQLVLVEFQSIKWYEYTDPFVVKWNEYIKNHSSDIDYYEMIYIGEDYNDNQTYYLNNCGAKGYYLTLNRYISFDED